MYIGEVADKSGLTPDTIRFYERNSLLPRLPRSEGGFRQYADSDVERLAFIQQVQALGFTLKEVRELLDFRGGRLRPCVPVRQRLEQKLADVQTKRADLEELERELRAVLRVCNRAMRKKSAECPLLTEPRE